MSAAELLDRYDVDAFKNKLNSLSARLAEVSVSGFKVHKCADCGEQLSTYGAVRCNRCNMRQVGKRKRRKNL